MRQPIRVDNLSLQGYGWPGMSKHIMRGDLGIATVQILDHISSVAFVGPSLRGPGLLREEARACQEGFTHYMDWQGLTIK